MEQLLHYVWKHRIFPLCELLTTDGRKVEVLNPGLHNTDAGPDFVGAKVKLDGTVWVGNVEIHVRTSDWFRHHHEKNATYDNIIMHVASDIDQKLFYPNGQEIPQLKLEVPQYVKDNYGELIQDDYSPRCRDVVRGLPMLMVHNWMTTLTLERFEERNRQITARREHLDKNWEDTLFVTLARNFGFGINGDAFEAWAQSIPMSAVGKHRDNLFQIEAIFFGQAGLLEDDTLTDDYYQRLKREYRYLRQKFTLTPIDASRWKFLRLRPQNFPYIRIAQLAMLYYEQRLNLSRLINAHDIDEIKALLLTHVSDYWSNHYSFGGEIAKTTERHLSEASLNLIIINSVAPMLFAYGRYKQNQELCDRAFALWEQMPPENNRIVRNWLTADVTCSNAADSQAIIHLTHKYCQTRDCLRCKFGVEFIRNTPDFLREDDKNEEPERKTHADSQRTTKKE